MDTQATGIWGNNGENGVLVKILYLVSRNKEYGIGLVAVLLVLNSVKWFYISYDSIYDTMFTILTLLPSLRGWLVTKFINNIMIILHILW